MTSIENERRHLPLDASAEEVDYIRIANPIASDRNVMRSSLLASMLDLAERNSRLTDRLAYFEIGPIFIPSEEQILPEEPLRLAILMMGKRAINSWQEADTTSMDFYDLKGTISALFERLNMEDIRFVQFQHPTYHPGKCARIRVRDEDVGVLGELHPLVRQRYDFPDVSQSGPVLAAELDLDKLMPLIPERKNITPIPAFPPVLEDLAIVLDESIPAEHVVNTIIKAGGKLIASADVFDVYRGEQVSAGKKSLAYSLTYQAPDRTLTDKEVAKIRKRIVRSLENELGAVLRS
jgi:phenylalanyl-tRNA synthetase beta chain